MANLKALPEQPSIVAAWLEAVSNLDSSAKKTYNLIYTISDPCALSVADKAVIAVFNKHASSLGVHSVETVANTIFPLDTYRAKGPEEFYAFYLDEILPKVRKKWGTYFERMITRRNDDGSLMSKDGIRLNPLLRLIEKLKRRVDGETKTTTHYELSLEEDYFDLATFDPLWDGSYQVGGPCLSHLSFKVDGDGALRLTAFYRSHWYVSRALGNLIGLARLQAFVASRVNIEAGPLTVIASEAVLDLSGKGRNAAGTRKMLTECQSVYSSQSVAA